MQDVTVIGAGISGCLTALKLAQQHKVLLIEAEDEVLPTTSSSHNECYKLHTGAHFLGDLATARHCLNRAISFAREYPHFLASNDLSSPWRRGRHYIMSNSLVSPERAKEVVLQLQDDYAKLVAADEKNKVFGEPTNFIKFLSTEDYPYLAKTIPFYDAANTKTDIHIALGIETAESQIDILKLKTNIQQQIQEHPNITFMPARQVTRISRNSSALGCIVTAQNKAGQEQIFKTRSIVNCTWQNIEILNNTLGLPMLQDERVIRIKISVLVELPEALRNMNTCIFSSGPYASITVLPNGTAVLTSERTTNAGFFKAGAVMPDPIKTLLANMTLETTQGQDVAKKIISECASYLSEELQDEFQAMPIKELRVGFVKVMGAYTQQSIYQANSSIHARLDDGIEELEAGFIANASMKMTYAASNATTVNSMLATHFVILNKMEELIARIKSTLYFKHPLLQQFNTMVNSFLYNTYRNVIEEKVCSLTFEQNIEQYINELVDIIFKNFNSLMLRRCNNFFSNLYIRLHNLVEDTITSRGSTQCNIPLDPSSEIATTMRQKSDTFYSRAASQQSYSFFSEARRLHSSAENSSEGSPIPSPV